VIDEIARQTNLLALKRRGRSGTSGRGGPRFAVVATEVPQPAHASSQAAKDIKDLITTAPVRSRKVWTSSTRRGSLKDIVDSIKKVADIVQISPMQRRAGDRLEEVKRH